MSSPSWVEQEGQVQAASQVLLVRLSGGEGSGATSAVDRAVNQPQGPSGQACSTELPGTLPPSWPCRAGKLLAGTTPWTLQVGTPSAKS